MKILLYKSRNGGVYPAYPSDYENLKRVKAGEYFTAEVIKPRNILLLRKFFALMNLVFSNQEQYKSIDHLREDITIEAGFYTTDVNIHGEVVKRPKSISFAAMDDLEFQDLYGKCVDVIVRYFHFDREDIALEVEQFF